MIKKIAASDILNEVKCVLQNLRTYLYKLVLRSMTESNIYI